VGVLTWEASYAGVKIVDGREHTASQSCHNLIAAIEDDGNGKRAPFLDVSERGEGGVHSAEACKRQTSATFELFYFIQEVKGEN